MNLQKSRKWVKVNESSDYIDFDKELLNCNDVGDTSLDLRLTFNLMDRTAYMTVAWHNDDGNTDDLDGQRQIDWNAALLMLGDDVEIPETICA